MMKRVKEISDQVRNLAYVAIILIVTTMNVYGQSQSIYAGYIYNKILINPAYAGTDEQLTATVATRLNWVGIDGAPQSQILTLHAPVPKKNVSFGMVVANDDVAIMNETSVQLIAGYRIYTKKHIISFGLQPTITNARLKVSELQGVDPDDPSFASGDISEMNFDFGYGVYMAHPFYYLGASVSRIISGGVNMDMDVDMFRQTSFHAGYITDLGRSVKLQPNIFISHVVGSPIKYDLNLTLLMNERLMVGVTSQSLGSLGGSLGFLATDRLTVVYSYDYSFDFQSVLANNSHELMIKYSFKKLKSRHISTRYF